MQKKKSKTDLIQIQNQALLDRLKGDEKIGIDKEGRVYVAQKEDPMQALFREISLFFKRKEKNEIALKWAIHSFEQEKKYQPTLNRLLKLHLIAPYQKQDIVFQWYAIRIEDLIAKGFKHETAAAIVTMEMYFDPLISDHYKKIIEPQRIGTSSYLLKNMHGQVIGVFKPEAENETYIIAEGGVDSVPYSVPIAIPLPPKPIEKKNGIFQFFCKGRSAMELSDDEIVSIPNEEVQRVALLDLMIENGHRGREHLLYDSSQHLIAIGQGKCFSDEVNSVCFFWPQIKAPLSENLKMLLLKYPIEAQCAKLNRERAERHKERIKFLQKKVDVGHNLESLIHVFV